MRVVFFGTPLFAAEVLDYLLINDIEVCAIVSKPDRAKGRSGTPSPTPVKLSAFARNPDIPIYQPELVSAEDFAPILKNYNPDLFVVVAYGEIIKQHLLEMPRIACINLHTSLLPKYRGAAPIQRAVINGEIETGVTIMHMVKKMDAGDIIDQIKVPIGSETTFGELEDQLCQVGKESLLKVIRSFAKEKCLPCFPQDSSLVTYAPKIELEDCEIHWELTAKELHNLIRGVNPYPGAWCYVNFKNEKKRFKINRTRIVQCNNQQPGTLLNYNVSRANNIVVATGENALELLDIQMEGKKRMSSEEFVRGFAFSRPDSFSFN